MKRLVVFAERKIKGGTVMVRAGNAVENRDGSLVVYLDVLPLDGRLIIRQPVGTERDQEWVELVDGIAGPRCLTQEMKGTGRHDPARCLLPAGHAGEHVFRSIPEVPAHGP